MNSEWWVDLAKLDRDQGEILNLDFNQDHLIVGPPGSGKTNLLLLRANWVSSISPNILVVVFGRTLREFIARGSSQYKFDIEKLKTSAKCFYDLLREYDCAVPGKEIPFEQARRELTERTRALRASLDGPPYEAVFVDEAQDFLPEEIDVLQSLGNRFFAVADSRQQLYTGGSGIARLEATCNVHRLRFHYRNGVSICRLADSIGKGMPSYERTLPTCHYPEDNLPSSFEWVEVAFEEQVKSIVEQIEIQTKAFPSDMLAVICPKNADVDRMYQALMTTSIAGKVVKQSSEDGYSEFDVNKPVCLTTMHGCKGLEFRAVHGAMLESLRRFPLQRNLIFTLTTRAKTSLRLYGDPIPPFVKSALLAISPPRELPPITRAFGGEPE